MVNCGSEPLRTSENAALFTTTRGALRKVNSKPRSEAQHACQVHAKCKDLGRSKTFRSIHDSNEHKRRHVCRRENGTIAIDPGF